MVKDRSVPLFDVRKESEYFLGNVQSSLNTPLDFLNDHLNQFPEKEPFYIHCAGGYRSIIAASVLKKRGIHNLVDIRGGFKAIKEAGVELSDLIFSTTSKD